jgi:pyruvate,orthophosphate dikinase
LAVGEVTLDESSAVSRHKAGVAGLVVRLRAQTCDIAAFESAVGLLTRRGARTSRAAVVLRLLGKVCLVGCGELRIDAAAPSIRIGDTNLQEGDPIVLEGSEGDFHAGADSVEPRHPQALFARLDALGPRETQA